MDEVDCTKSEKFYSLNLELYGSTLAPPVIQQDQSKPQAEPTEQSQQQAKPSEPEKVHPAEEDAPVENDKSHGIQPEVEDSTEDPVDTKKEEHHSNNQYLPASSTFTSPEQEEANEGSCRVFKLYRMLYFPLF